MDVFCRELPKVELHAHLNGSLSRSTMLQLRRLHADTGLVDRTNAFFDEFQIGAGDKRNLSDCFQVFGIAHSLTTTPEALKMATLLTLKEFQDDGCCYIELRSSPRNTPYMTQRQYVETLIKTMRENPNNLTILPQLILSINRSCPLSEGEETVNLAVEYYKNFPEILVGIDLSGNPTAGRFQDFVPALTRAKEAGLKITLHCGEICNPREISEMLKFKPDRIGHGVYIHPKFGGNEEIWNELRNSKIPVELCLTSNIRTKSIPDYNSHHFKEFYEAKVPITLGTDDKGVFATSLSQEYHICADTFQLQKRDLLDLAINASKYIFAEDAYEIINNKLQLFWNKNEKK
ncbi:N6-Methyl-AMP deaminase [Epargyreus clarus]|uniref:N6-Methyl-AMP deaminase n=1 Tax=Epargyreus clarus TaxID=520877 RepID=UPI003C2B1974